MAMPPIPDTFRFATIRAVGGRGGSTYEDTSGNPPASIDDPIGQGNAGGGGGGGSICVVVSGNLTIHAAEFFVQGKEGGNSPDIEGGGRIVQDRGGNGGGGKVFLADADGIDGNEFITNPVYFIGSDTLSRDLDLDGNADITDPDEILDRLEMTSNVVVGVGVYGDDAREIRFGRTCLVTEFFDTLSDNVSYDEVRVLSNAPRFPYSADTPGLRTIQVFVDAASAAPGGVPDLATEDPEGTLFPGPALPDGTPTGGSSIDVGLHYDRTTGLENPMGEAQYESRFLIPANSPMLGRRFVRVRLCFDLSLVGTPAELLSSFAPATAANLAIADDPMTPALENTLGNTDTAPSGVPAVAEIRVRFTP
jgi:hypothetical protein